MRCFYWPFGRIALLTAAVLVVGAGACDGTDGAPPQPAPNFTLTDTNADSPTYGQARQLSEAQGRVIVIHFALYT